MERSNTEEREIEKEEKRKKERRKRESGKRKERGGKERNNTVLRDGIVWYGIFTAPRRLVSAYASAVFLGYTWI